MLNRSFLGLSALLLAVAALTPPAHAWEKHLSLMSSVLEGIPQSRSGLDRPLQAPCPTDDRRMYERLAQELQLNPKATVLPTALEACTKRTTVTGREILAQWFVDEPDHGMDQDLPGPIESYDPQNAAKWMGGTSGKTSTGFRHMYFGGWQLWHPLKTFQVPPRAIGYAPHRAALMARKARALIGEEGIEAAWGYRVLAWALHYLQDLSQPFHAVQIPDLRMVPWYTMLHWPPDEAFADLVRETTRTIANYHWAFEHYTYYRLTQQAGNGVGQEPLNPYQGCLSVPDSRAVLSHDPRKEELASDPLFLAERVARASVQIGEEVGRSNIRFFGTLLKDREVDIPNGKGEPAYAQLTLQPDLVEQREALGAVTCRALADASLASRLAIAWATGPR